MKGYDVGEQLLNRVAVLSDGAEDGLVLVMDLMVAVESGNLVEDLMDKHVKEVVSYHHYRYCFHDFPVRWETLKLQSSPSHRQPNVDIEWEYHGLVEEGDLQGPPFHVVPVVPFPRFLEVGLDLVLLVGLDAQISRDVQKREYQRRGEEVDSSGRELKEHLVLYAFRPYGLGEDGNIVEVTKEQIVSYQHVCESLLPVFETLDVVNASNDLLRLLKHYYNYIWGLGKVIAGKWLRHFYKIEFAAG